MGLFSSLFGSAGSDKADRMRQSAIDAFNSIKTPQLSDLQVQLDKEVSAGTLTPEQAEAQLLNSNAFNDIKTDPSLTGAAKQALTQMQQIGTQGGMTAIDRAQLQDITNQTNQLAQSRNASVLQNAQQRGIGGSGIELANTLSNEQAAADRASAAGTNVAANAQQRALQAIQAAGGLGQSLEAQQYGEEAKKAETQNAIDLFNKQTANATNLYNVGTANEAQTRNLANAQNIANTNTGIANTNKTYNAAQNQQVFNDAMAKASGVANEYNQGATAAEKQKQEESGANLALLGGGLKAAGTGAGFMLGGPAGAAVASGVTNIGGGNTTNKNYNENMLPGYAEGGEVDPNENRSMSPDHAEPENKYSHECYSEFCLHPEHDIDPQPPLNENRGLTRAEAEPENKSLEDAYNDFVQKYAYGGTVRMADGGMVKIKSSTKEPLHMNQPHSEGYADGGIVDPQTQDLSDKQRLDLAMAQSNVSSPQNAANGQNKIPTASHPDDKNDRSLPSRLGQLLGSHADIANEIDRNRGGMIHDMRKGGMVPGVSKVRGDSPRNDTVPARLSPGEIVLPRTVAQNPIKAPNFISKTLSREDPTSLALKRLRQAHLNQGA